MRTILQLADHSGLWPAIGGGHAARDTGAVIEAAGFAIERQLLCLLGEGCRRAGGSARLTGHGHHRQPAAARLGQAVSQPPCG
jgi:hypothetical protein